jgi:DNA-binding NarL/FixJ family response regulator
MRQNASAEVADRVVERRRAVALANHYREAEGLSIAQIAGRLGRSPATIKAYFYDPSYANKRLTVAQRFPRSRRPPCRCCSKPAGEGPARMGFF